MTWRHPRDFTAAQLLDKRGGLRRACVQLSQAEVHTDSLSGGFVWLSDTSGASNWSLMSAVVQGRLSGCMKRGGVGLVDVMLLNLQNE